MNIVFFHQRRENTTGLQSLQLCWTLDIQESLQVVSFHGFNAFSSQKNTPNAFHAPVCPCDIIAAKMMPPSGRAHPQAYCVPKMK